MGGRRRCLGLWTAAAVFLAAAAIASGCSGSGDSPTIALLMPETAAARFEAQTRSALTHEIEALCGDCQVSYQGAGGSASKQEHQGEAALKEGAKVLVVDPVDVAAETELVEKSKGKHVPVLSYDKLLINSRVDYYVSFDNEKIGELQGEALAHKMGQDGHPKGPVVMVTGNVEDFDTTNFTYGANTVFRAKGVKEAGAYGPPEYHPSGGTKQYAEEDIQEALSEHGRNGFAGVYAADDEIADGVIAGMEAARIDPATKPTVGEGATLAGLQHVLAGQQYMTVYRPIEPEAKLGAEFAVALAQGEKVPKSKITIEESNGLRDVPAGLLEGVTVTKQNLKQTVLADGFVTAGELCVGKYVRACREAGIS